MNSRPSTLNPLSCAHSVQPSVHLHIERLVVSGLPLEDGEGPLLLAAAEAELTRLLANPGWPGIADGALASAVAKPISLGQSSSPDRIGMSLAQAVYDAVAETFSPSSDRFSVGGVGRQTPTANQPQRKIKL